MAIYTTYKDHFFIGTHDRLKTSKPPADSLVSFFDRIWNDSELKGCVFWSYGNKI